MTGVAVALAVGTAVVGYNARLRAYARHELEHRAGAMAEVLAQGLAGGEVGPADAKGCLERVRGALPEVAAVTLRDGGGAIVAEARAPGERRPDAVTARREVKRPARALEVEVAVDPESTDFSGSLLPFRAALGALVAALLAGAMGWLLARRLTRPASAVARAAARIAGGDLRLDVEVAGGDEMSEVADALAKLSRGLRGTLADLKGSAESVARHAELVAEGSRTQVKVVAGQTAAMEETVHTVADLAQASRVATENAQLVIEVVGRSEELWKGGERALRSGMEGLRALDQRVGAIASAVTELSEETVRIAGIIAAVKELSEQSNVLALNASIEAAKVGEEGRGFAVVADEMRQLAEQSRRATDEVRARLGALQRATRRVVSATSEGSESARTAADAASQASGTISGLASAIEESARAARGIAETTRRQTEEMEGIAAAVEFLHEAMGDSLQGARQVEQVAQELDALAGKLRTAASGYLV